VAISQHGTNASRDAAAMLGQLDVIARRYGIRVDRAMHYRWAAWLALLEGRRGRAIRYYVRAVGAGDPGSLARAVLAAVWPGAVTRRGSSDDADAWIAEARTWLEDVSIAPSGSPG
jgi:hypothetical protein